MSKEPNFLSEFATASLGIGLSAKDHDRTR